MSRLSQPPSIKCQDGTLFFVEDRDDVLIATVAYPDPALTMVEIEGQVVLVMDLDLGGRSVTNDAERVVITWSRAAS